MKKIIILLAVLACGVGEVKAWDDVYLVSPLNGWKNYDDRTNKFYKVNENEYYIYLPPRLVTSSNFDFRFLVYSNSGSEQDLWGPSSDDNKTISTSDYYGGTNIDDWKDKNHAFHIQANVSYTAGVKLILNYNNNVNSENWTWHITIEEQSETSTVAFVKPDTWEGVKAYLWDDDSKIYYSISAFPGDLVSVIDNVYPVSISKSVTPKVVFSNSASEETKTSDFLIENNAVYDYSSKVNPKSITISNDVGTYSSDYPLTFPEGDVNIRAYKAEMEGGKVKLSRVTGVVPAKTGLVIARKDAENNSMDAVPAAVATADVTGNLLKPGTGSAVASEGTTTYRYALAKKKSTSEIYFAKLAAGSTNTVAIGKAYLEVTSGAAPSFEIFFDDAAGGTTAIDAVKSAEPSVTDGAYYNLAGQRVTNPTKGLYIVNGRKVVVK